MLELMKLNHFVVRQDHLLSAITVERRTAVEMGHEDADDDV